MANLGHLQLPASNPMSCDASRHHPGPFLAPDIALRCPYSHDSPTPKSMHIASPSGGHFPRFSFDAKLRDRPPSPFPFTDWTPPTLLHLPLRRSVANRHPPAHHISWRRKRRVSHPLEVSAISTSFSTHSDTFRCTTTYPRGTQMRRRRIELVPRPSFAPNARRRGRSALPPPPRPSPSLETRRRGGLSSSQLPFPSLARNARQRGRFCSTTPSLARNARRRGRFCSTPPPP